MYIPLGGEGERRWTGIYHWTGSGDPDARQWVLDTTPPPSTTTGIRPWPSFVCFEFPPNVLTSPPSQGLGNPKTETKASPFDLGTFRSHPSLRQSRYRNPKSPCAQAAPPKPPYVSQCLSTRLLLDCPRDRCVSGGQDRGGGSREQDLRRGIEAGPKLSCLWIRECLGKRVRIVGGLHVCFFLPLATSILSRSTSY